MSISCLENVTLFHVKENKPNPVIQMHQTHKRGRFPPPPPHTHTHFHGAKIEIEGKIMVAPKTFAVEKLSEYRFRRHFSKGKVAYIISESIFFYI